MINYNDFVFKGGWRLCVEGIAEDFGEEAAKDLLWNIMTACTNGDFSTKKQFIANFITGCCLPFLESPKLYWKKASSELSKSALIVYLLMQEDGVKDITPTYIENWGLMRKGTASKAISELKEKGYLIDGELVHKAEDDIHWKPSEKKDKIYTVYKHIFPNKKEYIGITSQIPEDRWKDGRGYKNNTEMYSAILQYGWNQIKHEILFTGLSYNEAREIELKMIADLKENCYNIEGRITEE